MVACKGGKERQQGAGFAPVGLMDAIKRRGGQEVRAVEGKRGDQKRGGLDVLDDVGAGVGGGKEGPGLLGGERGCWKREDEVPRGWSDGGSDYASLLHGRDGEATVEGRGDVVGVALAAACLEANLFVREIESSEMVCEEDASEECGGGGAATHAQGDFVFDSEMEGGAGGGKVSVGIEDEVVLEGRDEVGVATGGFDGGLGALGCVHIEIEGHGEAEGVEAGAEVGGGGGDFEVKWGHGDLLAKGLTPITPMERSIRIKLRPLKYFGVAGCFLDYVGVGGWGYGVAGEGEEEAEDSAAGGAGSGVPAADLQGAVVALHDFERDPEAEAGAGGAFGGEEGLEDALEVFGFDTDAGVGDRDRHAWDSGDGMSGR